MGRLDDTCERNAAVRFSTRFRSTNNPIPSDCPKSIGASGREKGVMDRHMQEIKLYSHWREAVGRI